MISSHTYQLLPLIPVDEFLARYPEHADDGENALMIARINHERAEREALEHQRLELQKRKQKLIADNKKRRDDLANLDKDLEKFIDVSPLCSLPSLHVAGLNQRALTRHRQQNQYRKCSRRWFEAGGSRDPFFTGSYSCKISLGG